MGWSIGFDSNWNRDVGYGVPATCDHPGCGKAVDRGLGYVCGGDVYGGEHGCGLFFCGDHLAPSGGEDGDWAMVCERCRAGEDAEPFEPTPDTSEWVHWKLTDESWGEWRSDNPDAVAAMRATTALETGSPGTPEGVNKNPVPQPNREG